MQTRTAHIAGDVGGALQFGEAKVAHFPDGALWVARVRQNVVPETHTRGTQNSLAEHITLKPHTQPNP
jgi:hypothetical protein